MVIKKILLIIVIVGFVINLVSCKRSKTYDISQMMKEYFAYREGSYWKYINDSTGISDCTYVNYYKHAFDDASYKKIDREVISVQYSSNFLSTSFISYFNCEGPDYYEIGRKIPNLSGEAVVSTLAFYAGWPQNVFVVPECFSGGLFYYKFISSDTINNTVYNDVIFSELRSADSSSANPNYFLQRIYFAKHIGIIKFIEISKYYNINRSYSLLNYHVIQ